MKAPRWASGSETADSCIECVMAWLLRGDGAVCLLHKQPVYWKGTK